MTNIASLRARVESGKSILLAEVAPPPSVDAELVRRKAAAYQGKVHALGVSDNRDQARMSALAAASLVAGEGVEPLLHIVTRDRNRVALQSECLGALALGIGNVLCTSGTHQTLGTICSRPQRIRHRHGPTAETLRRPGHQRFSLPGRHGRSLRRSYGVAG